VSISTLAEMVRDAAGSKSEIVRVPYAEAYAEGFEDMMRRVPSIEKIRGHLGWEPKIALEEIVRDVVASVA
jgi:UDP-glucose 4-epimerase